MRTYRKCFTHWREGRCYRPRGELSESVICFAVLAFNTARSRERMALRYMLPFIVNLSRGRDILTP
jgi:hypothetical protein